MGKQDKADKKFWRLWHKWVGLIFSIFVILFCVSGIILNHRDAVSAVDISRSWLPGDYKISNYNNGIIKGTEEFKDDSVICYGVSGCFVADKGFNNFRSCNNGFDKGVDNRKICHIVRDNRNNIICAAQKDVFIYDTVAGRWQKIAIKGNNERLADIVSKGDTLFVLTRSCIYQMSYPYDRAKRIELKVNNDYKNRITLFKTIWYLHSGALFGLGGRIVVDILGIVLIFLSLSGIIYFFLPFHIRRRARQNKQVRKESSFLRFNLKYHKKLGVNLIVLTILLAFTGMCLRPPLMVPLVLNSSKPLKFTALDNQNPFSDKLRSIRWNNYDDYWIISTSEGFYKIKDLEKDTVIKIENSPYISPMGINVFEQNEDGSWLIGSFSGMYKWDITNGGITDYFTGKPYKPTKGRPVGKVMVSGFARNIQDKNIIFTYDSGALSRLPGTPDILKQQPVSLWNTALELHTGRLYACFLSSGVNLFIFISGVLLIMILISGYKITKKKKHKDNNITTQNNNIKQ